LLGALLLLGGCAAFAQANGSGQSNAPAQTASPPSPCIQPAPLVSVEDYTGPMRRVVLAIARKPDIKTVQRPATGGGRICALAAGQKFHLFVRNTFEPITVVSSAFDAGVGQALDSDPSFGQGAEGYGKRVGAAMADRVSSGFFRTFVFPMMFRQDPRYYRMGQGDTGARMGHALTHVFVAHGDSGKEMFNFSEWMGTTAAVALANTYHPDNRRGMGPACGRIAVSVGTDVGFDLLREFWPELVHKFKLPFRDPAKRSATPPVKR